MSEYGVRLAPEDYYPLEGVRVRELPGRFFAKHGQPPRDERVIVEKKERYYLAHHGVAFYPGVEAFIRQLQVRRVPIAMVTTGLADRVKQSVPRGFLEQFGAVVTGDETSEGKPSPAPYRLGAKRLGVPPEACIVVENAPLGIESAKRAGTYCIALCTTLPRRELAQADEVLDAFDELREAPLVKQLLEATQHGNPRELARRCGPP